MIVRPCEVAVAHAPQRFDEEGRLADGDLREQLADLVEELFGEVRAREPVAA